MKKYKKIQKTTIFIILFIAIIFTSGCQSKNLKEVKNETQVESYESSNKTQSEIHFIDTGNSDAILIKQGNSAALIDGGDNDDEGKVVEYLKKSGIEELDYIFATHPHADHIGGLDAVINSIPVKNVYVSNGDANTKTYRDFIKAISNKGLYPSVPLLNSEFKLESSKFKVLSVANTDDLNNNSIVLEYINGKDKILLMGDAEAEIESKINVEDVDLLKVGHHGSHSSTTKNFLEKASPEYAVIMVGKDNRYGHPHKETMEKLKQNNIEVHRSDECGNIVVVSTGNGLKVDCKKGSYKSGSEKGYLVNTKKYKNNDFKKEIVYWTPNGSSYHTTSKCSGLRKSKNILSGTIKDSGKFDPCNICH